MKTVALVLALLAVPAGDPETRFHEAYLLEVVEGKVADAAREYVALFTDGATPARIKREAKFRFAVCCVLLGRADEARAWLAEILADPETPDAMKARAEEYKKAADGIGIGTELDRKLQELVFELGRTASDPEPPVFRDFQVIGKPAVPTLRKLLGHPDRKLRQGAFRILSLLDEPGLAEAWSPGILYQRKQFTDYLTRHPEEVRRLEEKLLALGEEVLDRELQVLVGFSGFSMDFISALSRRLESRALGFLARGNLNEERLSTLVRWVREGNEKLAPGAAQLLTGHLGNDFSPELATEDLFPVAVRRLVDTPTTKVSSKGLEAWARSVPRTTCLSVLRELLGTGGKWEGEPRANPLLSGLADAVASGLDRETEVDVRDYAALVRKWIEISLRPENEDVFYPSTPFRFPFARILPHLTFLFRTLPEEDAIDLVTWIFKVPARGRAGRFATSLHLESERDVAVFLAACRTTEGDDRKSVLGMGWVRSQAQAVAAEPVARALPELLRLSAGVKRITPVQYFFPRLALSIPEEVAVEILVDLFAVGRDLPSQEQSRGFQGLLYRRSSMTPDEFDAYRTRVVAPALPRVWDVLEGADRPKLLDVAVQLFKDGREEVGPFILEHIGAVQAVLLAEIARHPDLFPLEKWIPVASSLGRQALGEIDPAAAEAAARKMTADPADVNWRVLDFVKRAKMANAETSREIFDRLLEDEDPERIGLVVGWLGTGGAPASPGALERALARILEAEDDSLRTLSRLADFLASVRPSEKLFPAASRLMASADYELVLTGINLARRLGREDLLPDLVKLLDSMDELTRTKAKEAMDSILELKRIKKEAEQRIPDK